MSGNKKDGQAPVDNKNRPGKAFEPCHKENKGDNHKTAYGGSFNNIEKI